MHSMPAQKFTQPFLNSLRPRSEVYEESDTQTKGLKIRVRPNGRRILVYQWTRGKRVDIGDYPAVTLSLARQEVPRIIARIRNGEDPRPEWRRPAEPKPNRDSSPTIRELYESYEKHHTRLKTAQGYASNGLMSLHSVLIEIGDEKAEGFDAGKWRDSLLAPNRKKVTVKIGSKEKRQTIRPRATSIKTANRKLAALRSLYQWGIEKKLVGTNPAAEVKLLKEGNTDAPLVRALDPKQEKQLRAALDNRTDYLKPLWLVGFNTGLRRGELLRLAWGDIQDKQLVVRKSKTGTSRWVPLNAEAQAALEDWRFVNPTDPVFPVKDFKRTWSTLRKDIGLERTWNECTRHSFATRLLTKGVSPHTVQKLLGHTTTRMQAVYGHLLLDDARAAVEGI
jgi:integrase